MSLEGMMRYGPRGQMSYRSIGKVLGMTGEGVRKAERRAMAKVGGVEGLREALKALADSKEGSKEDEEWSVLIPEEEE